MIEREYGYLKPRVTETPESARQLHERGYVALREVFAGEILETLKAEIAEAFALEEPDGRARPESEADQFRYAMLNRSAASQRAIGHPRILETIEPLLGEDCHVIANTAWRNPGGTERAREGDHWHIDAGPHVPRSPGIEWPEEIPYPVFAIGAHILLQDLRAEDGPTGFIPGSHRSGQSPPFASMKRAELTWNGQGVEFEVGRAGDVILFVSDVWHRRLPTAAGDAGRFFLQAHYGRRDIAQRLRSTRECNQLSEEAIARADTKRARRLAGLHPPGFYDG